MKTFLFHLGAALSLLVATFPTSGADAAAANLPAKKAESAQKQLQTLVAKIKAKLGAGKRTPEDMADELKQFDIILAEHKDEKTDDVAQVLYMKAVLYKEVFQNPDKEGELMDQLAKDFPETKLGQMAKQQEGARKIQQSLAVGKKFPDLSENDINGKPMSISHYKGKVVLVDFWATWCVPCKVELPNVLATYKKHHASGFEIVGISLDQDLEALKKFTAANQMPWQQFFDGKAWQNKLAQAYGVGSIPATYLLDGTGTIIGKDLRGEDLEKAVAEALAKK